MKKRSTGPYKKIDEPLCDQSQYSVSQLSLISKKVTCLVEFQVRFDFVQVSQSSADFFYYETCTRNIAQNSFLIVNIL